MPVWRSFVSHKCGFGFAQMESVGNGEGDNSVIPRLTSSAVKLRTCWRAHTWEADDVQQRSLAVGKCVSVEGNKLSMAFTVESSSPTGTYYTVTFQAGEDGGSLVASCTCPASVSGVLQPLGWCKHRHALAMALVDTEHERTRDLDAASRKSACDVEHSGCVNVFNHILLSRHITI